MQYVFIALAIIFYIVRFISKQKKEQAEAAKRQQQIPSDIPPVISTSASPVNQDVNQQPPPKTIDEILQEMHRRVETQSKPYAKPVSPREIKQKQAVKKEFPQSVRKVQPAKESTPFLTAENAAYDIEVQRNMHEDFIKQGELTDIYNEPKKNSAIKKFNLRDAILAQIILQRPEWYEE